MMITTSQWKKDLKRDTKKEIIKALAANDPAEKRRHETGAKKLVALLRYLHGTDGRQTAARLDTGERYAIVEKRRR